jgi:hypothetical protein
MTFPEQNNLEIWKPITGYENYEISSWGRVKNSSGLFLKIQDRKGYKRIILLKKSKHKSFLIHRLVAVNFIPNPKNLLEINHIDGNKQNNNVENLEWVSRYENMKHAEDNFLLAQGETHGNSKLTEIEVLEIRRIYKKGMGTELAKKYNVARQTITSIIRKKLWKNI